MLAIRMKVPYVVDLYDNYESFGQARIPGFRNILSVCIKDADITIAVSKALGKKICSDYKKCDSVLVMSNGVICSNFFKGDKRIARIELGLPLDVRLIGTAGNLSRMKGLDTVYEAFSEIVTQTEDVYLVLAGPVEKGFPVPDSPRVIYLGELLERNVGQLFRALDVGIIPAHDSEFGRYCFPQKLYEMVACELPVIAANIGALSDILQDKPEMLFKPGISEDLVKTAMHQFDRQQLTGLKVMEWGELVSDMEPLLSKLSKLGND